MDRRSSVTIATKKLSKGSTASFSGHGRVTVTSGRVEVFGATLAVKSSFRVRLGRQMPAFARDESASLEIAGRIKFFISHGDPLPSSWRKIPDLFLFRNMPTVMVLGPVDSGKSSFCTFLANTALNVSNNVGLVDGDLGQADMGPPGCISAGLATKQFTDLRQIRPVYTGFVGAISPSLDVNGCIEQLRRSVQVIRSFSPFYLLINTDGWVDSEGLKHKRSVVDEIMPDTLVYIDASQASNLNSLGREIVTVERPANVLRRGPEIRARARLANLMRFFRGSQLKSIPREKIEGRDFCEPEEGALVGFYESGNFVGLGLCEGRSNKDSLAIHTNVEHYQIVRIGKSAIPELLDILKRTRGY